MTNKPLLTQLGQYYMAGTIGNLVSIPLTYLLTSNLGIFYLWSSIIAGQIPGLLIFFIRRKLLFSNINPSITKDLNR